METLKCQSCSIRKIKPILDNIEKPTNIIINKYEEIESFCKNNEGKILNLFYFYRNNIQEILYNSDNIINIEELEINSKLSELFYLSLLLWNSNLVNFSYSFDFISKMDSKNQSNKNYLKKIILSKIIIILIDYTKALDYYYQNQNELEKIRKSNIEIIENNLELFKKEFKLKYDVKSFINKKIDDIYMEIIVSLFKKNKFDNKDYYENIFKQLDLESIDITQTIFDGLSKELDIEKNKYLENLMINEDRLDDEKVINFYNILFNTILKNPKYIYKNNFLIISRNIFDELIKNNSKKVNKFIIKQFISESFLNQDKDDPNIPIKSKSASESQIFRGCDEEREDDRDKNVSTYQSSKLKAETFESKKTNKIEINTAREILKKLKITIDIDFKTLKKITIINTLFEYGKDYKETINYEDDLYNFVKSDTEENDNDKKEKDNDKKEKDNDKKENDKDKKENDNDNDNKENDKNKKENDKDKKLNDEDKKFYKKFNQFLNFLDEIKEYILESKIRFNPKITLELTRIELKSGDFDMKCISSFENKKLGKILKFTDNNILANGINGKNIGFILLIQELSEDEYLGEGYAEDLK